MKTHQFSKIKDAITKPKYRWLFIAWIIIFSTLNIYINEIYVVGFGFLDYKLIISIPLIFFTVLNTFLVAVSINLIIMRFKELKSASLISGGGLSAVGVFFALLTGACPGCIAGFFPIVMGIFGSQFTLSQLPFFGIELQVISAILMLVGIFFLTKPVTCKIEVE